MTLTKSRRSPVQRYVLVLLGVVTLPILAACGAEDAPPARQRDAQLAQGAAVYAQYCASCHGAEGEGQRPDAPLQKDDTGRFPAPPHDETGHTWHHDDDLLIEIVRDGGMGDENFYEMPAFGATLDDAEIKAVLAFIKTMWTDEQRAAQQARTDAARES